MNALAKAALILSCAVLGISVGLLKERRAPVLEPAAEWSSMLEEPPSVDDDHHRAQPDLILESNGIEHVQSYATEPAKREGGSVKVARPTAGSPSPSGRELGEHDGTVEDYSHTLRDCRQAVGLGANVRDWEQRDFAGVILHYVDFRCADLTEANFGGASLVDADFRWANLSRADFSDANLTGVDFSRATLQHVVLTRATLHGADFSGSTLQRADFSETNAMGAMMVGADMRNVRFRCVRCGDQPRACLGGRPECVDEEYGHFRGADFSEADLRGADLGHSSLALVDLTRADLRGANLEDTWYWNDHPAIWQGALYDETTKFPADFDPHAVGMKLVAIGNESDAESHNDEKRRSSLYLVGQDTQQAGLIQHGEGP